MKQKKTLEDQLYIIGLFFLIFGILGVILYFHILLNHVKAPSCMLYRVFGIYCPGCGGTRAIAALLRGEILRSLWYHPLVLYVAVIYAGFMLTHTLKRLKVPGIKGWKFHNWYLYGMVVVTAVNWIGKNILLHFFDVAL